MSGPDAACRCFSRSAGFNAEERPQRFRRPFCAVVRDITQWKQTEAELRDAKDEAERDEPPEIGVPGPHLA